MKYSDFNRDLFQNKRAKAALDTISDDIKQNKDLHDIIKIRELFRNDVVVHNAISYFLNSIDYENLSEISNIKRKIKSDLNRTHNNTASNCVRKISSRKNILVHNVNEELFLGVKQVPDKTKLLHVLEHRPNNIGRENALDFAKLGFKVMFHLDSHLSHAINDSDICILGCKAITKKGDIVAYHFSEILCDLAKYIGVPVYFVASGYRYDFDNVFNDNSPLEHPWDPKNEKIYLNNSNTEIVKANLVDGIISDFGVMSPKSYVWEIKNYHKWIL